MLLKSDGTKYGKTEGGTVWLDPDLTSPYAFYQYWFNVDDADVGMLLRRLTFLPHASITELDAATRDEPARRHAQRALAAEVTGLVHGQQAVAQAESASQAVFGRADLSDLTPQTLAGVMSTLPHVVVDPSAEAPTVADLLTQTGLTPSKGAARRAATEGGVYVNNARVHDADSQVDRGTLLHGRWLVLRRGRRTVAGVDMGGGPA